MLVKELPRDSIKNTNTKLAIGEWVSTVGLRCPSLIAIDVTDNKYPEDYTELEVLKHKRINSFKDYKRNGRSKFRIPGYRFLWHHRSMNKEFYCIFLGYKAID